MKKDIKKIVLESISNSDSLINNMPTTILDRLKSIDEEKLIIIPRDGSDLIIPNNNEDSLGVFIVESSQGNNCYAHNIVSTQTYYVIDGSGTFIIDGKEIPASIGTIVKVAPNSISYYIGNMILVETLEPNFKEENFIIDKEVTYSKTK